LHEASITASPIVVTMTSLAAPWAELYRNSKMLESGVAFAHFGALLVSGGLAIGADRSTLRAAAASGPVRVHHMNELSGVHRPVVVGLVIVFLSGVLLFGADVETYVASPAFWIKMGLIVLLLGNGLVMQRAEGWLAGGERAAARAWVVLRRTSIASLALWLAVTLAGVVLTNNA
jgi:uncharacterized membrane protein